MRVNRQNPRHLAVLAFSLITTIFALFVHYVFLLKKPKKKVIIFYGHTLNGNLKAFYDRLQKLDEYDAYFLILDKTYLDVLIKRGEDRSRLLYALNLKDMYRVGRASAFITSHGLHFFSPLRRFTNIVFIDLWHGVPYKGFDATDLSHLHDHTETWVSSESLKKIYTDRLGFNPDKVRVTGYGRVDQLVDKSLNKDQIIRKYKIKEAQKYVLIAPTWAQDEKGRSILPFGVQEETFFGDLDKIAKKCNANIIFRTHLNSNEHMGMDKLTNIQFMPYAKYEIAEDFLFIADLLVTDWSSIGFDYLPLNRPTLFLDVRAPFKKGFTVGPEYRFGEIVSDFPGLKKSIELYLQSPDIYLKKYASIIKKTKSFVYGSTLDGKTLDRYQHALEEVLKTKDG